MCTSYNQPRRARLSVQLKYRYVMCRIPAGGCSLSGPWQQDFCTERREVRSIFGSFSFQLHSQAKKSKWPRINQSLHRGFLGSGADWRGQSVKMDPALTYYSLF